MTAAHRSGVPVWRRALFWIPIAILGAAGMVAGFVQSMWSETGYEAVGTLFVGFDFPPDTEDPFSAAQFVAQRIDTYAELGQSEEILQAVGDEVGGVSAQDLSGRVTVVAVPGSVLLRVTAQDGDATTAAKIVDTTMAELGKAVSGVESGANVSPVELSPVQPALVGPASSLIGTLMLVGGGLVVGGLLGGLIGWVLAIMRPRGQRQTVVAPANSNGGRHRCALTPPAAADRGERERPEMADSVR